MTPRLLEQRGADDMPICLWATPRREHPDSSNPGLHGIDSKRRANVLFGDLGAAAGRDRRPESHGISARTWARSAR